MKRSSSPRHFNGEVWKDGKKPEREKKFSKIPKPEEAPEKLGVGDKISFYSKGVLYEGKVERVPNPCNHTDKVLVTAHPKHQPTNEHQYLKMRYELKSLEVDHFLDFKKKKTFPESSDPAPKLETRKYEFTVKGTVEIGEKNLPFVLKAESEGRSSSEAMDKLLENEDFKIETTNSLNRKYVYEGKWKKLKERAIVWEVTTRIRK